MNELQEFANNQYIIVPMFIWLGIQVFKVLWDLIKEKKLNFKRILGAGGMPSSHSAVVCSIATLIGRNEGFDSAIFGLAVIMALVVMYDAAGVRRAAGKQAKLLNKIVNTPGLAIETVQEKLVEVLGHTPVEVFVGAVLGIVVGLLV